MLDIFNNNAFGVVPLSLALRDLNFMPGRIREMGLFSEGGIATTQLAIERVGETLQLVSPTPRGGPGVTMDKEKRDLRSVNVPHFEINDAIMAEEVQGVRQFGSETATEQVMAKVAERGRMARNNFEVTHEHARLGAIKGTVVYANGSELNMNTLFGTTPQDEVDFELAAANPDDGALRRKCAGVIRAMATALDGVPFTGVHAFCGDNFFDDLLQHSEVRDTYKGWSEAQILRDGYVSPTGKVYSAFEFGGIVWENYRGSIGGSAFVNTDKCHIFPMGTPELFVTRFAPADYVETVNTMGQPIYGQIYQMQNNKGVHMDMQTNAVHICTRPRALIPGKRTL